MVISSIEQATNHNKTQQNKKACVQFLVYIYVPCTVANDEMYYEHVICVIHEITDSTN